MLFEADLIIGFKPFSVCAFLIHVINSTLIIAIYYLTWWYGLANLFRLFKMKKTIIATTLRFIPKKLQYKALCKALNYLLANRKLQNFENKIIRLTVSDLKKSWLVVYTEHSFEPTKVRISDVEIKTKLNTAMTSNTKSLIAKGLENNDIKVIGDPKLTEAVTSFLYQVDERRLMNLSTHLFSFFKMKTTPPPRLDIDTVELKQLTHPLDVDFIRDEALRLENKDLKKALFLMELAHQARPKGPFIAKKVKQYKERLKEY